MRRTVTTKLMKEFAKMHCQGYLTKEIAEKYGFSIWTISKYLTQAG